ncbi:hypothetical protein [Mycoplasma seminis]|uniref:Nucleotidyltransferase n=1 Tax=Mycoplasma seminis TaxID=512749 RepID=A0ABY9H9Y3_9MOLU|nr:hypothetical protein [Mycoplasma seminis]WLP85400.1 hypothetical protein Q8852_03705 [Mycoplasma seminis]
MRSKEKNYSNIIKQLGNKVIIQGSHALYIQGIISRKPNDIDILLDLKDENLFKRSIFWNEIKKQLTIDNEIVNHEFFNSLLVKISENENINLECMIFKQIPTSFITTINDIKFINAKYMLGFKICQLFTNLFKNFKNREFKIRKIQNYVQDINLIIQAEEISFNETFEIWIQCITINLPYEIMCYKKSPYLKLKEININELLEEYKIDMHQNQNAYDALKFIQSSKEYNEFYKWIDNLYDIKNEILMFMQLFCLENNMNIKETLDNFGPYVKAQNNNLTTACFIFLIKKLKLNYNVFQINDLVSQYTVSNKGDLYIDLLNLSLDITNKIA